MEHVRHYIVDHLPALTCVSSDRGVTTSQPPLPLMFQVTGETMPTTLPSKCKTEGYPAHLNPSHSCFEWWRGYHLSTTPPTHILSDGGENLQYSPCSHLKHSSFTSTLCHSSPPVCCSPPHPVLKHLLFILKWVGMFAIHLRKYFIKYFM